MRVETQITGVDVDELLLQFAGATPVLNEEEVRRFIEAAGGEGDHDRVIEQLRDVAFSAFRPVLTGLCSRTTRESSGEPLC